MDKPQEILISPKTRVGELLDVYPELEPILMKLAPAFKKLKNPVLRRTVVKVATLQQAAAVGNVSLSVIINTLRSEVGQAIFDDKGIPAEINDVEPPWFDKEKIEVRYDASPIIDSGQNPMQEILENLGNTSQNGIFMLITAFVPAPIIELIRKKGYVHYCLKKDENIIHTFFYRNP